MANRVVLNPLEVQRQSIGLATRLVSRTCDDIRDSAKRRVQVRTGQTRATIRTSIKVTTSHVRGTVESTKKQAMILHDGSKPHVILPRKKRALAFYWKKIGQHVVLSGVNHPGTRGTRYLTIPLVAYGTARGFRVTLRPRSPFS